MSTSVLLDSLLPVYHVSNIHKKHCKAIPNLAFKAVQRLTFNQIPLTGKLIHLRTILLKIVKREFKGRIIKTHNHKVDNRAILDLKESSEWIQLGYVPGKELAIGFIGNFWNTHPELIPLPFGVKQFLEFAEPGNAKAVLSFRIIEKEPYCSILIETRVYALDALSRRKLRFYWSIIAPGMWFVRKMWLLGLKQKAEFYQTRKLIS
ncbi:MAG: hypothetical protein ACXAD7_09165 [Candidatus Kariarchaeaceae archaeon]|jgi:hypothetical protein